MEEFEEQMPETTKYALGYFEGRQSTKRWICCEEDLMAMYTAYATCSGKEILLWCDGRDNEDCGPKSKRRKTSDVVSKREETEQRVLEIAEELEEMHEDDNTLNFSEVQYRLWARMIVTGVHNSKESPPQVPMITGSTPRRSQRKSQETIISTAAAVVKAINNSPNSSTTQSPRIQQNLHPKVVASISGN